MNRNKGGMWTRGGSSGLTLQQLGNYLDWLEAHGQKSSGVCEGPGPGFALQGNPGQVVALAPVTASGSRLSGIISKKRVEAAL